MAESSWVKHGVNSELWHQIIIPCMMKKYNYRCADCNTKEHLDVHHLNYDVQTIDNLIVLCRKCHKTRHFLEGIELDKFMDLYNKCYTDKQISTILNISKIKVFRIRKMYKLASKHKR